MKKRVIVIGGGAAGIFAAALCAEAASDSQVIVLEKTRQLLSKVRISGGGRCNVTHAQFEPQKLVQNYPRGNKELLGPFHRFQPKDTIAWFKKRGVSLKTEEDGRMFPITDSSQTIIDTLLEAAKKGGVEIRTGASVQKIEKRDGLFHLQLHQNNLKNRNFEEEPTQSKTDSTGSFGLEEEDVMECENVILATGSNPQGHLLASSLGHTLSPPVPSLFTFNTPRSPLLDLAGIALADAEIQLKGTQYKQRGNMLLTHWGFSGPCVLKLSAWAARHLHACGYRAELSINWIPALSAEEVLKLLFTSKQQKPNKSIENENPFPLPSNLWKRLLEKGNIPASTPLRTLSLSRLQNLAQILQSDNYAIEGKTTFKQEFVTCGGINLKEVHFKTMESRLVPGLYFAGEVLDIDGVTGGFNFQNAWTTAYLASNSIACD